MRLVLIISIFLLSGPMRLAASELSLKEALDSFKAANELYQDSEFRAALFRYRSILEKGFESADLYFNLGNAHYKLENYAMSIWSYEKSLMLEPGFSEAKTNLELANKSVVDKVQDLPRIVWWHYWQRLKSIFGVGGWTTLSIIMLWLLAAGGFLLLTQKIHILKRIGVYLVIFGFSGAIFTGGIALNKKMHLNNPNAAIITSSNVYVKSAPEENSADLYVIHSGLKVALTDEIGDWLKIQLADGKTGWVLKKEMKGL